MVVISDTSAISNLVQVKLLLIIRDLYGQIIIPKAVYEELAVMSDHRKILEKSDWIQVKDIQNRELYNQLRESLHHGEAEAIVLAIETQSDLLVIDELAGRKIARKYGLRIIGILGILVIAKNKGLISRVEPYMRKLREEVGFWISPKLYKGILEQVKEDQELEN